MNPKSIIKCVFSVMIFVSVSLNAQQKLAERILNDRKLEKIREMGYEILKTGFNAGYGYQQVWARDMNKMASGFASHRNIPHSLSLETMQSSMFKF